MHLACRCELKAKFLLSIKRFTAVGSGNSTLLGLVKDLVLRFLLSLTYNTSPGFDWAEVRHAVLRVEGLRVRGAQSFGVLSSGFMD